MNPYQPVINFEETIAEWAGSKYAVAVDSGTNAIFLSIVYAYEFISKEKKPIRIPRRTYPSVPCSIIHAGGKVEFWGEDTPYNNWQGTYNLYPYFITDGALRFQKNMYQGGFHCLSFHIKKRLPIGRGGMILTDNEHAAKWFRKARFDGRNPVPLLEDNLDMLGWNCYMTPAQAALGLQMFDIIKDRNLPDLKVEDQGYPDLSKFSIYQQ